MQKDILVGSSLKLWKEQKACPKAKRARNRRDRGRTKEWIMIKNKNGGWLEKGEWLVVVHNILKGTIKRIAFINIIITSRMSLSTNKCVNCQIPVYRMKQYSCCNKNEYICTLCSSHPCDNCKKGRFNVHLPAFRPTPLPSFGAATTGTIAHSSRNVPAAPKRSTPSTSPSNSPIAKFSSATPVSTPSTANSVRV